MVNAALHDTIAAISTAPGRSAVAIIRVTGPEATSILRRICPELGGVLPEPRFQRLLWVVDPESFERIDRALVTLFSGSRSYTGEDTVEVATHGGLLTPQLVLNACYAAGARPAMPGEFTRRALMNGRLDLLQAEAILDIIDGTSPALHRTAIHQMERGLSRRIEELRRELIRVEALVAYGIDFPDEDEPPVPQRLVREAGERVLRSLEGILETAPQGELLRAGALVVLAGVPNSGKSSLFNALLGVERAIVTEVAGTTRDAIEVSMTIEGYPFRLVDTAGLRSDASDRAEAIGVEVARRYLSRADIVVFCSPEGQPFGPEEVAFVGDLGPVRAILAFTKNDLRGPEGIGQRGAGLPWASVSSVTGEGLPRLREHLLEYAYGGIVAASEDAPLVTRARHTRAIRSATQDVRLFVHALSEGVPMELATTHLASAAGALEEMIGVFTPDDVLGEVFSQFCVGK